MNLFNNTAVWMCCNYFKIMSRRYSLEDVVGFRSLGISVNFEDLEL